MILKWAKLDSKTTSSLKARYYQLASKMRPSSPFLMSSPRFFKSLDANTFSNHSNEQLLYTSQAATPTKQLKSIKGTCMFYFHKICRIT
jgi:hypothetical protein